MGGFNLDAAMTFPIQTGTTRMAANGTCFSHSQSPGAGALEPQNEQGRNVSGDVLWNPRRNRNLLDTDEAAIHTGMNIYILHHIELNHFISHHIT